MIANGSSGETFIQWYYEKKSAKKTQFMKKRARQSSYRPRTNISLPGSALASSNLHSSNSSSPNIPPSVLESSRKGGLETTRKGGLETARSGDAFLGATPRLLGKLKNDKKRDGESEKEKDKDKKDRDKKDKDGKEKDKEKEKEKDTKDKEKKEKKSKSADPTGKSPLILSDKFAGDRGKEFLAGALCDLGISISRQLSALQIDVV